MMLTKEMERTIGEFARTPGLPRDVYNVCADALCWTRGFSKAETARMLLPGALRSLVRELKACADNSPVVFDKLQDIEDLLVQSGEDS